MSDKFDRLVEIIKKLREPDGCPWDREQTLYSLKQNVIEEVFEFIDALDRKDVDNIKEELGDMLLHVIFHSIIAEQDGLFKMDDVINGISDKLVRRHPHVFGDVAVGGVDEVLKNWDDIKSHEKHNKQKHYLDDVPRSLPSIERAYKLQQKVGKVGFDWSSAEKCFKKVEEEFNELKQALIGSKKEEIEHEIGDLIFSLINLSRFADVNPSESLRKSSLRFENRFGCVESRLKKDKILLKKASLDNMEKIWQECKKLEK